MATRQYATGHLTPPRGRPPRSQADLAAIDDAKAHLPADNHPWATGARTAPRKRKPKRQAPDRPYLRLGPQARAVVDEQVATLLALAARRRLLREFETGLDLEQSQSEGAIYDFDNL